MNKKIDLKQFSLKAGKWTVLAIWTVAVFLVTFIVKFVWNVFMDEDRDSRHGTVYGVEVGEYDPEMLHHPDYDSTGRRIR